MQIFNHLLLNDKKDIVCMCVCVSDTLTQSSEHISLCICKGLPLLHCDGLGKFFLKRMRTLYQLYSLKSSFTQTRALNYCGRTNMLSVHLFIHPSKPTAGVGLDTSCHMVRGGVHSEQVTSLLQG